MVFAGGINRSFLKGELTRCDPLVRFLGVSFVEALVFWSQDFLGRPTMPDFPKLKALFLGELDHT